MDKGTPAKVHFVGVAEIPNNSVLQRHNVPYNIWLMDFCPNKNKKERMDEMEKRKKFKREKDKRKTNAMPWCLFDYFGNISLACRE